MNIVELLAQQVKERPSQTAIMELQGQVPQAYSFADLNQASLTIANNLATRGIVAGDRILVMVPMSFQLYALLAGLWRLGAVALFVDPREGKEILQGCCNEHQPKAFVSTGKGQLLRLISPPLRAIRINFTTGQWFPGATSLLNEKVGGREQIHVDQVESNDLALITFSSGTTGQPKAILRSHDFLAKQYHQVAMALQLLKGAGDVVTLPIFLLANLAAGMTSFIYPTSNKPVVKDLLASLEHAHKAGVSRLSASPVAIQDMVDICVKQKVSLSWVRQVNVGGSPILPDLTKRLTRIFPTASLVALYGASEAEPIAKLDLHEVSHADYQLMATGGGVLVGRPVSGIRLAIIEDRFGENLFSCSLDEFKAMQLEVGSIGEIVVAGDHVLEEYHDPQANGLHKIQVDSSRWHRTGDAGYVDSSGRLWLVGRCTSKLVRGDANCYPLTIESAVQFTFSVSKCALVEQQGKRILVVQKPTDLTYAALVEALPWASVDKLVVIDHIPCDRRQMGKTDYAKLRHKLTV